MSSALNLIARSEFSKIARHPVVAITVGFLFFLIFINAIGCQYLLPQFKLTGHQEVFSQGWLNTEVPTLQILTFLSLCIGVISISGERTNGSLRVLITKPLYRRDIITGKMAGIVAFLVIINLFVGLLNISLIMIFYGGPDSVFEIFNIGIYTLIMSLFCALITGIMILSAIVFKGLSESLLFAASFLYLTWNVEFMPGSLGIFRLVNPVIQVTAAIGAAESFSMISAMPFIVLMIVETIAIYLASCAAFNFEET